MRRARCVCVIDTGIMPYARCQLIGRDVVALDEALDQEHLGWAELAIRGGKGWRRTLLLVSDRDTDYGHVGSQSD